LDQVGSDGSTKRVFGFRGTAKLRDLVPDVQLALNRKSIPRLDEARKFVQTVGKEFPPVGAKDTEFYGHSLGGFIAEGVRQDYAGTRATVVHAGHPVVNMKDGKVNA